MIDSDSRHLPRLAVTAALLAWGLAPAALRPRALSDDRPNRADMERIERGYYERLLDGPRRPDEPARGTWARPESEPFDGGPLTLPAGDLREFVLKPGLATTHLGVPWTTNALGMRDREYDRSKPPGVARIALVGDSIGAGWGVSDGRGFEPLLEEALDRRSHNAGGRSVEVLNFSVPGHGPGARWLDFRASGWDLGIDLVLFEATPADPGWDERRLRGLLPRGIGWESPLYRDALAAAGVRPGGTVEDYKRALRPQRWELLAGVYRAVVAECRERGVPALWVLLPRVGRPIEPGDRTRLIELARAAGFDAAIDLSDAFDGLDPSALAIAPTDFHPNIEGHARLAQRLEAALVERPEWRRVSGPGIGDLRHRAGGARPAAMVFPSPLGEGGRRPGEGSDAIGPPRAFGEVHAMYPHPAAARLPSPRGEGKKNSGAGGDRP